MSFVIVRSSSIPSCSRFREHGRSPEPMPGMLCLQGGFHEKKQSESKLLYHYVFSAVYLSRVSFFPENCVECPTDTGNLQMNFKFEHYGV